MLYHQTKFGCRRISSLEDTVETTIFWLCKPFLWPWCQHTTLSAWHFIWWWCTTVPSLVTKQTRSGHTDRQTGRQVPGRTKRPSWFHDLLLVLHLQLGAQSWTCHVQGGCPFARKRCIGRSRGKPCTCSAVRRCRSHSHHTQLQDGRPFPLQFSPLRLCLLDKRQTPILVPHGEKKKKIEHTNWFISSRFYCWKCPLTTFATSLTVTHSFLWLNTLNNCVVKLWRHKTKWNKFLEKWHVLHQNYSESKQMSSTFLFNRGNTLHYKTVLTVLCIGSDTARVLTVTSESCG